MTIKNKRPLYGDGNTTSLKNKRPLYGGGGVVVLSIENIISESNNKSAKQRIRQGLLIVSNAKKENNRDGFKVGIDLLKEGLRGILQELSVQGGDAEK